MIIYQDFSEARSCLEDTEGVDNFLALEEGNNKEDNAVAVEVITKTRSTDMMPLGKTLDNHYEAANARVKCDTKLDVNIRMVLVLQGNICWEQRCLK